MKAMLCSLTAVGGAALLTLTMSAPSASAASAASPAKGLCGGPVIGDYNGNGVVDVADLVNFNAYYDHGSLLADLNKSCTVDVGDIVIMYQYAYPSGVSTAIDFNFDGKIDVADPVSYDTAYAAGDSRCDMNGDCSVDVADFYLFWNGWLGCTGF